MVDGNKVQQRIDKRDEILGEAYKHFFEGRHGIYRVPKELTTSDREFACVFEYLAGKSLIDTKQDGAGLYVTITPYGIDYVENKILGKDQ